MKSLSFLLLIFVFSATSSFSQNTNPFDFLKNDSYFDAYYHLIENKSSFIKSKQENSYWQALGTLYAFLGQYEKAENCYNYRDSVFKLIPSEKKQMNISNNAIELVDLANIYKKYNVVMINEAHYKSQHRAFVYNQLPVFRQLGFKYLAIEALSNGDYLDSSLMGRGYPVYYKTGIYVNDPVFAHLVRRAIALGFELIPYEASDFTKREEEQAANILKHFNPLKGKLLVYAGYAHICESDSDNLMGSFLKKGLGSDVLSISQVLPKNSDFITDKPGQFHFVPNNDGCYDYYLYHPQTHENGNIPDWYSLLEFKYKPLSFYYKHRIQIPALIQVFSSKEAEGIPVYQYLVEEEQKDIMLAFPGKGEYKIQVNQSGKFHNLSCKKAH